MKTSTRLLVCLLALLISAPAFGDEQQKAQKELNRLTAMARDFTGRTMVNLSISQTLGVPRTVLVQQRGETGLNYGSLFLAGELVKSGTKWDEIVAQLKSGKTIQQIANDQHANWTKIAEDAKKLNTRVDDNLYHYFLDEKRATAQDTADKYDPHYDGVKADADDASEKEIATAGERFRLWKDRAAKTQGADRDKQLGLGDERIGYVDHHGGPGASGAGGRGQGGTANTTSGVGSPAGFGGPQ
ncbi:MAG TPA: hypothetical protein VFB00_00440 [Terriglobales bacterium]|nr:hypothetical protein [Terriglobales bacterium]